MRWGRAGSGSRPGLGLGVGGTNAATRPPRRGGRGPPLTRWGWQSPPVRRPRHGRERRGGQKRGPRKRAAPAVGGTSRRGGSHGADPHAPRPSRRPPRCGRPSRVRELLPAPVPPPTLVASGVGIAQGFMIALGGLAAPAQGGFNEVTPNLASILVRGGVPPPSAHHVPLITTQHAAHRLCCLLGSPPFQCLIQLRPPTLRMALNDR